MVRRGKGVKPIVDGLRSLADDMRGKRMKATLKDLGEILVEEIKATVSKGVSPITGKRFPAYKNPARYPGTRKPKRPVNLYLTGEMLAALTFRIKQGAGNIVTIYLKTQSAQRKEQGHREGAGGQPLRPIIPEGQERLTRGIYARLREHVQKSFGGPRQARRR